MHQYIKAIGFEDVCSKKDFIHILKEVEESYSQQTIVSYEKNVDYCEMRREYGQDIGISVCGELDDDDVFDMEYYFPYFNSSEISLLTEVSVEKKWDREQYTGVCEDPRLGISLIFSVQNGIEVVRKNLKNFKNHKIAVKLSGLSLSGMILLPVHKSESQQRNANEASRNRRKLVTAARNGDQRAIESLTLDDMTIYTSVSQRLVTEDVLTIIDTYFMPYGADCEVYSILGEILAVRERENVVTHKKLYQMKINANELIFDICIPKERLFGEPEIGRRFKGEIWLQGALDFSRFK